MPLDNKCRIGPLAGAPPDTCAVVISTETESGFITEDDTFSLSHSKLPEVGKNPVDTAYDVGSVLSSDLFSVWFGNSQNDHQARRRFVEWAQNEIAVVPDFHKRILFSDEAHFWLNGYVNKQNCRIGSEANPQVYVETPLHPEKLTVWCAVWAGGILLHKR
ncbi:hypothetical protein TNCV_188631 [Trichonephila clavipes]|nr:hypothetical protein TNCV_188631 [Trichonephila clavipes]